MNFKVFISVNIHPVALSWSSREREHPALAARSLLHLVWDTLEIHVSSPVKMPLGFRSDQRSWNVSSCRDIVPRAALCLYKSHDHDRSCVHWLDEHSIYRKNSISSCTKIRLLCNSIVILFELHNNLTCVNHWIYTYSVWCGIRPCGRERGCREL
jgi:hypothetical protein